MNRFFVDVDGRDIGTDISITGGDVNHIKNVLRLKVGQEITVSNGRGRIIRAVYRSLAETRFCATSRM